MSNPQDPTESRPLEPPELPHPELEPPGQLGFDYPAPGSGAPPPAATEPAAPPPTRSNHDTHAGPGHDASAAGYGNPPPAMPGGTTSPGYVAPGRTTPSAPGMPSYGEPAPGESTFGASVAHEGRVEYGSPGWGGGSPYPATSTHGAPTGYAADVGWVPSTPSTPAYGAPTGYPAGYAGAPPGYDQAPGGHGQPAGYGQPGYGAPIEYGAGYGGVPPGYDRAPSGHGGPAPGYQPPAPGYGYSPPGFGPPPPYAGWLHRVGAAVIDGLLIGIPAWILDVLGNTVGSNPVTCSTDLDGYRYCTGGGLTTTGAVLVGLGALVGLVGALYLLYLEGTTGQTPGKRVLGIKLIREADGQVIGFWWAVVRSICHILDALPCYLGYLWPLWDDKRQTFADKIMKTIVVKV